MRHDDPPSRRIRAILTGKTAVEHGPTVAEVMAALPDISGPEFDWVFEEIEKFQHARS